MTVIATTRRESARPVLNEAGAAHVVIDDGRIEEKVRALAPGGVDAALELVGIPVPGDTLRTERSIPTRCPARTWSCWAEASRGWCPTYARSRRRATSAWVVCGNMSKRRPSMGRSAGVAARSVASEAGLHEE